MTGLMFLVVGAISGIVYLFWYLVRRRTHDTPEIKECQENYKPDVVYLWTFKRPTRCLPDLSPYALKVETYLRICRIPYETRHIKFNERSKKGQIPFIYLNGEEFSDSTVIIKALAKHFKVSVDDHLSAEERGSGQAFGRMIDQATVWTYFYYRYVVANIKLWRAVQLPYNKHLTWLIAKLTAYGMRKRSAEQGTGRLSETEMWAVAYDDLKAISQYLGYKKYFLGDKPTTVDAVLFAHLAQIVYIDIPYPHLTYITTEFTNILTYCRTVKEELWPDWDQLLTPAAAGASH